MSASSAVRWVGLHEETGSVSPRRRGGKSRSPLEPHASWLLELDCRGAGPDPGGDRAAAVGRIAGVRTTDSSVDRFFTRHGVSFKKNSARRRAGTARRGRGAATLEGRPGKP